MFKSKFKTINSRDVPTELMRQMWKLRLEYFPLREGASEEQDWAGFSKYFDRENRVAVAGISKEGQLYGYTLFSKDFVSHDNRKGMLIQIEYTYVRKDHRGGVSTITAMAGVVTKWMVAHGFPKTYFVAFCFPNSYVFQSATMKRVLALQDDDIPSWERSVLTKFAEKAAGKNWDPKLGVAWYKNNIPPESPPLDELSPTIRGFHERYDRLNPLWREGAAIPIIIPINFKTVMLAVKKVFKRLRRNYQLW